MPEVTLEVWLAIPLAVLLLVDMADQTERAVTHIQELSVAAMVVTFATVKTFPAPLKMMLRAPVTAEARALVLVVLLLLQVAATPLLRLLTAVPPLLVSSRFHQVIQLLTIDLASAPVFRNGGGNAFSGATGDDRGGDVINATNDDSDITNTGAANLPGAGGNSASGNANGGDA